MKGITMASLGETGMLATGCGGGGGTEAPAGSSASQYVVFDGNVNREIVLDGAGAQFAVRRDDRRLVHLSSNQPLNGLTVASNGDVVRNGAKIGVVLLAVGADSKAVAALSCSGPSPNLGAMTVIVTNTDWSYRCASNTSNSPTPTTPISPQPGPGEPADNGAAQVRISCVILEQQNSLGWRVRNNCQEPVTVSFCFVNPDSGSWANGSRCSDNQYGSSGTIPAQSSSSIPSPGNTPGINYSYRFLACAATASRTYLPLMSNQGQTGRCS